MTVPVSVLFKERYFQGFLPASEFDYESVILSNTEWVKRGIAEHDPTRKQPIAYCVLANLLSREIYVYQRSGAEERLNEKFSFGFGGHIERVDKQGNPIHTSLLRELEEEADIPHISRLSTIGYINDDSNEVGKVHFGVLYVAEIDTREISIREGASSAELKHSRELGRRLQSKQFDFEEWSRIAYEPSSSLVESVRLDLLLDILDNKKCGEPDPITQTQDREARSFVRNNMGIVELRERNVQFCGLSFEQRLIFEYDLLCGGEMTGSYKETRIFDKMQGPSLTFGRFDN